MSWLKFETDTPEKPEVFAITNTMGWTEPDLTVGKLLKVWRWFDQHTIDGYASKFTCPMLDNIVGVTGFAEAMAKAGWLLIEEGGLRLPNFDRHNGNTAKRRALGASRVALHRTAGRSGADVTHDALPKEEKKRKEKNYCAPQALRETGNDEFEQFWAAYPKKKGKAPAKEAWLKEQPNLDVVLKALDMQKRLSQWKDSNGQYVPYPANWIEERRWEDEVRIADLSLADRLLLRNR